MSNRSYRIKILFVCSRNKWRSLTAEKMFQNSIYDVRSAGTEAGARVKLTAGHIGWADWIFVMEKKHLQVIRDRYGDLSGKIVKCLNISDDYHFMDPQLVRLLESKLRRYVVLPD